MINIGNPKGKSDSYQVVRPAPCPDAGLLGGLPRPVWAKLRREFCTVREFCIPSQLRSASLGFAERRAFAGNDIFVLDTTLNLKEGKK